MKRNTKLFVLLFLILTFFLTFFVWKYLVQDEGFECRAQMKRILIADNTCNKSSVFDVFLSMQHNGEGYLLVSGTYSCPDSDQTSVDGIERFTYKKEGNYFSLYFNNKNKKLGDIFNVLDYDNIKIKITPMTNGDYIIASPIETIMMCSTE
ncbi:Uncharacterised protein [Yersinia intermedia]|jgi:hypothetical protein|uniref:hypothetical protein n=1 Tax=Yersinia intermedia TaxID=631 RepID=UPI0005E6F621|nr:hypothetical protein [Yersinia intermedia]MCB5322830.1 hypothetical protein [Yersinia intermedia]UZM72362.1 hypothetical protein OP861_06885 [Yersinia intermedia]CNC53259.1 Uncharacterised protein [Yersinia intermedia]CNG58892.1 Uncharacterised protein [Yersinia intermedia]